MAKKTIEAQVAQASTLIMNASKHPKVKQQMSGFGYTDERMQQGLELVNTFRLLQAEKDSCYSRNQALKQQLDQDIKTLKSLYREHLTIARLPSVRMSICRLSYTSKANAKQTGQSGPCRYRISIAV